MATLKEQSKQLEELIKRQKETTGPVDSSIVDPLSTPELEQTPLFDIDYDNTYSRCKRRARRTITVMAKHILGTDDLDELYAKDKQEQDIHSLADLYYQADLNTTVLKSNIESIRMSGGTPRLYETFVQLSKNQTEINKQIIATENVIRQTYTAIKHEILTKKREDEEGQYVLEGPKPLGIEEGNDEKVPVYRGTKQLIMDKLREKKDAVKEIMSDEEIGEADFEETKEE